MEKRLLSVAEAAEYLNVSKDYVYDLKKDGKITYIQYGNASSPLFFDIRDLDTFREKHRKRDKEGSPKVTNSSL